MAKQDHGKGLEQSAVERLVFGNSSFMSALGELIKNAADALASLIKIITSMYFCSITDNGGGMDSDARVNFLSAGYSSKTAGSTGQFGTGSKKMFKYADRIEVVTAPQDDPDYIYVAKFTVMELAEDLSNKTNNCGWEQFPKKDAKDEQGNLYWPHEHQFGTELKFFFKPEFCSAKSTRVYRDRRLRGALSQRVSYACHSEIANYESTSISNPEIVNSVPVILVDEETLPDKNIVGEPFLESKYNTRFGDLRVEFYNLKDSTRDSGLYLGDTTSMPLGDVKFSAFFDQLSDEQQSRIPEVFRSSDVKGLILATYLREFSTDQRNEFKEGVREHHGTDLLIEYLNSIADDVANRLRITVKKSNPIGLKIDKEIDNIIALTKDRYGDDNRLNGGAETGSQPTAMPEVEPALEGIGDPGRRPVSPTSNSSSPKPYIKINRDEFAVGEEIIIELVVPEEFSSDGYCFYIGQSSALISSVEHPESTIKFVDGDENIIDAKSVNNKLVLIAEKPQDGALVTLIDNPTNRKTILKKEYRVVEQRMLRISAEEIKIQAGSVCRLKAINTDKALGKLDWKHDGVGSIVENNSGSTVSFGSNYTGKATVTLVDLGNGGITSSCKIEVIPGIEVVKSPDKKVLRIRNDFFEIDANPLFADQRTVTIKNSGTDEDSVHRLVINPASDGFNDVSDKETHLLNAIAREYARVFLVASIDEEEIIPNIDFYNKIEINANKILSEILSAR